MLTKALLTTGALLATQVAAKAYFSENFNDKDWSSRWVLSEWKPSSEIGEWSHTAGEWSVDDTDLGIKTAEDARFYGISAKMDDVLNNEGKDIAISYLVKHEQNIDCGGAYIKLMPSGLDQTKFGGDSDYAIMFGPDICGGSKKTHVIMNYARPVGETEAKNLEHKSIITCKSDEHAHVYTLVLKSDNTYDVKIDGASVQSGSLSENWDFQPPKEIKDPAVSKPEDWVDEAKIPDPNDEKPDGYDDIPAQIPDPEAVKPEDWDDEDDGDWEAPMIDNPEYKGPWTPALIDNPDYKGPWEHPLIPNPDFFEDESMYARCKDCEYVGFELWQVKAGTLFDDILVTDDLDAVAEHEQTLLKKIEALKAEKDKIDEVAKKAADEAAGEEVPEEEEEISEKDEL